MKYSYISIYIITTLACNLSIAASLPKNPQVINGDSQIFEGSNSSSLTIVSNTANNVIKWDSFDIGANSSVLFDRNNYLNLVNSKDKTVINGYLQGGGNVYIVNPNGVNIGNQAKIDVFKTFGISTALINDKQVNHFLQHGSFNNTNLGMGKIKVLGSIKANNIQLDGSQIIIKDASKLTDTIDAMHGHKYNNNSVQINSSNSRIDIGSQIKFDYSTSFNLDSSDGLVDHYGQQAISNSTEFLNINNSSDNYWLVDDIYFGSQDKAIIDNFNGKLDGAYNSISIDFNINKNGNYAIFNKLDKASLSNLQIKNSSVFIDENVKNANIAFIANAINNSELKNIELVDIDITTDLKSASNINLSTIATDTYNSNFNNINASFTQTAESNIENKVNFATLIINDNSANKYSGVILGHSNLNHAAILNPKTNDAIFNNKDTAFAYYQQQNSNLADNYIFNGTSFYQYHFLKPVFVNDYVNDYTGKVQDYSQVMQNTYFDINNYFEIKDNHLQTNAGHYQVNLSSNNGFYFVNSDKTNSYNGIGNFTINKINLGNIIINDYFLDSDNTPQFSIKNEHELNFVNNEKFDDLNLKFEVVGSKYDNGIYDIILTGDAANYTYTYTKGILEVRKPQISIPATPINPATPNPPIRIPATPINPAIPNPPVSIPATPINPAIPNPPVSVPAIPIKKIVSTYKKLNLYKDMLNNKQDRLNGTRIEALIKISSVNDFIDIDNSFKYKQQKLIPYLF